jgi:uncharacterized iron-regulated protein
MKTKLFLSTIIFVALFCCAQAFAEEVILPHRVIDARTMSVIDFEGLLGRCADARVVTLGENHDDPATHQMELAVLEGLYRRHDGNVVLSLEMFERDVQNILDGYLAGDVSEDEFLADSRPWGNYETDYRPMVEFMKMNGMPVIASNIPRDLAARVADVGFEGAQFNSGEIPFSSSAFEAPLDLYYEAFAATMMMPGMEAMGVTEQSIKNYYEAQVLKDETMAASVAIAARENPESVVLHCAGAFHLADYLGTYQRIKRNLVGDDTVSILVIPVADLLAPIPYDLSKADYWILVQGPAEEEMMEMPPMPVMPPMPPSDEEKEEYPDPGNE